MLQASDIVPSAAPHSVIASVDSRSGGVILRVFAAAVLGAIFAARHSRSRVVDSAWSLRSGLPCR